MYFLVYEYQRIQYLIFFTLFPIPSLTHMQTQSLDFSLVQPGHPDTQPYLPPLAQLQQMDVPALGKALSLIMQAVPFEARLALTRLSAPGLYEALKTAVAGGEQQAAAASSTSYPILFQKNQSDLWADHTLITSKMESMGIRRSLFDLLTFSSNSQQFLSDLSLHNSLLAHPFKIIEILFLGVEDQQRLLMNEAFYATTINLASFPNSQTTPQLQTEIAALLRQHLLMQLRNYLLDKDKINHNISKDRQRLTQIQLFWSRLPNKKKLPILLLNCKDVGALLCHLSQHNIQLPYKQLQMAINNILELEAPNIFSSLFQVPFSLINQPFVEYRRLVYHAFMKELENSKLTISPKHYRQDRDVIERKLLKEGSHQNRKKKGKGKKSLSSQSNETNYTEHELQFIENSSRYQQKRWEKEKQPLEIKPEHRMERSQEEKREPREHVYSTEKEGRSNRSGKGKVRPGKTKKDKEQKIKQNSELQTNAFLGNPETVGETETKKHNSIHSEKTLLSSTPQKLQAQSKQLEKNSQEEHWQDVIGQMVMSKLGEQLSEMSDGISEQANLYYERRIIAFSRIQFLLKYYSIPIKLFGSCANGIAVKNSDIDIAIDQSILYWTEFMPQNQKVALALEKVEELFGAYPCFKQLKLIKTAAIPVLKLAVDTSVPFFNEACLQLNRTHNAGLIHADITIETVNYDNQSCHLGIRTTAAIAKWLEEIKPLHSIVIVMKEFFAVNKLNLAYEGGLNTISMIVMLVAYILHAGLQQEENQAIVLQRILHFYSCQFDEKTTGVDLLKTFGDDVFYQKGSYPLDNPQLMKADLEIRDPICPGKNMTRNCYLFPEIKKMFKTMLESCFDRRLGEVQQVVASMNLHGRDWTPQALSSLKESICMPGNVFIESHSQMCNRL